jgi:surfactin synthase thioesterase subunit
MSGKTRGFSIVRPNPHAKVRLICFPYSGASASIFYPWAEILPGSIEICSYQYPGHGTRVSESLLSNLDELIVLVTQEIQPYLDKEYGLFGHSLGSLVAFELTRNLIANRLPAPKYLFLSGHNAPQIEEDEKNMHMLPDDKFIQRLRELNGTPEEILQNSELLDLLLPIIRADFTMSETYQFYSGDLFDIPIFTFGGLLDKYTHREGLDAWRAQTTALFSLRMFQGDHFFINQSRQQLLQVIAQEINRISPLGSK